MEGSVLQHAEVVPLKLWRGRMEHRVCVICFRQWVRGHTKTRVKESLVGTTTAHKTVRSATFKSSLNYIFPLKDIIWNGRGGKMRYNLAFGRWGIFPVFVLKKPLHSWPSLRAVAFLPSCHTVNVRIPLRPTWLMCGDFYLPPTQRDIWKQVICSIY